MRTFDETEDVTSRFAAQLESALLARALAETGGLPDERTRSLLALWLVGTFNGSAVALDPMGRGVLDWEPDGNGFRLVWTMPSGLACPLARLYQQIDDSWVAVVVAGVRDGLIEAMAAAEWGVSRLTSD